MRKYTAIWQARIAHERDWIEEILGPYISDHVTDTKHQVVQDNSILLDAFIDCHDPAYYAQFRGRNAFLVHFLDETYEGSYELYNNFRGVLRCFWSNTFNSSRVMKMPLGYCSGVSRSGRPIQRASARKYLWSFVGEVNKSSRPDMARALASAEPHFLCATDQPRGLATLKSFDGRSQSLEPSEFSDLLFDSVFSPCPMGNVNLECFRVYEALECGSIPIIEKRWTLDYFRNLLGDHPLPTVRSWPEARRMIGRMVDNPAQIDALQQRCISWWENYKQEYSANVGEFLRVRSADRTLWETSPCSFAQRLPGWNMLELARHHDLAALFRRTNRQITRFREQGKLRVTHRPGVKLD
jgi:hypothetical protein